VADRLVEEMQRHNAYVATESEADRIVEVCIQDDSPTRDLIGQDATVILERAGISAPPATKCVVLDRRPEDCPIVQHEQMMPVLPVLRVESFDEGVEVAIRTEHGFKHTAAIHSDSIDRITRFAKAIDTTVFVANAPAYAWVGVGAEGWLSQTIAGPTGEGVTDARTWTRQRMIALGGSLRVV
jgi:propionaldehyde dehydrogenase